MSDNVQILWADDEIDLLKPHVLFLEEKGFKIETDGLDKPCFILGDVWLFLWWIVVLGFTDLHLGLQS